MGQYLLNIVLNIHKKSTCIRKHYRPFSACSALLPLMKQVTHYTRKSPSATLTDDQQESEMVNSGLSEACETNILMIFIKTTGPVMILARTSQMLLQTPEIMFYSAAKLIPTFMNLVAMARKISWKVRKPMNYTFNSVPKKLLLKDFAKTNSETNSMQNMPNLKQERVMLTNQQKLMNQQ